MQCRRHSFSTTHVLASTKWRKETSQVPAHSTIGRKMPHDKSQPDKPPFGLLPSTPVHKQPHHLQQETADVQSSGLAGKGSGGKSWKDILRLRKRGKIIAPSSSLDNVCASLPPPPPLLTKKEFVLFVWLLKNLGFIINFVSFI